MERKWVIAAFLDLVGFRSWTYRAATSPEDKEEFLVEFYKVLQCYVRSHPETWCKYEGDALMVVQEFDTMERASTLPMKQFVRSLINLLRKVRKVMRRATSCPDSVRVRAMDGYVFKIMVLDPNDPQREKLIPEYLEYCTNTIRGLLEVNPEKAFMVTKSLSKHISRGKSPLSVRPLGQPSCYPKGVNREDVDGLSVVQA